MLYIICYQGNANQNNIEIVNFQTTEQLCLFCMLVKFMLKIHQARLQQYVNRELSQVQGLENVEQIANILWIIEKAREFQKSIYFCFIDHAKAFDYVDHNKLENSSRGDGDTRPPNLPPENFVCRARSNKLELHVKQWTGSKLGKE